MQRTATLSLLAWLAVPLLFAGFVAASYKVALGNGQLPFLGGREWHWFFAFGILDLAGAFCAWKTCENRFRAAVYAVSYFLVMGVALAGLGLLLACNFGDCL